MYFVLVFWFLCPANTHKKKIVILFSFFSFFSWQASCNTVFSASILFNFGPFFCVSCEGVYVGGVTLKGGAAEAGVKEGDVVLSIDGVEVNKTSELQEQVSMHHPGDKVKLIVKRDGKTKQFTVTLRNSYGSTDIVKEKDGVSGLLGAEIRELTKDEKESMGVDFGLKITDLSNGKLRDSGVREGFIILKANRVPVKTISDLKNVISATNEGLFLTGVYPNGQVAYYGINLEN